MLGRKIGGAGFCPPHADRSDCQNDPDRDHLNGESEEKGRGRFKTCHRSTLWTRTKLCGATQMGHTTNYRNCAI